MASSKYSSALRAEQAARTRQRVLLAAAELFAADGFTRTTLARIADAAGVSVETVQAQGSKRSLLTAAVHQLSFGDPGDRYSTAPQAEAARDAATAAEFCRHGAELAATFNERTYRLWRAFSSAAADDPAVDREFGELSSFIREQCRQIVVELGERGWVRDDVEFDELGDSMWMLVGSENYDKGTTRLGWSHERYVAWLTRSLDELLFRRGTGVSAGPARN